MAQTNYQRGANKERRIVNAAREKGYLAFRSAGSHSPIDVFILKPKTFEIILIQSKLYNKKMSNNAKDKLVGSIKQFEGIYKVQCAVLEKGSNEI